jgi:hypothetical protein
MQISIKDFSTSFPFTAESIAPTMGVSKAWMARIFYYETSKRPELSRRNLLKVQYHLRESAEKMATLKLTKENFTESIRNLPISTNKLSMAMGEGLFWLDDTLLLPPHRLKIETVMRVQEEINEIGKQISDLTFTDYIEHDEVAHYLLKFGRSFSFKKV